MLTQVTQRIREQLAPVKEQLKDIPGLPGMFEQCFLNTLETTVNLMPQGDTFVLTGDIPAMWLRDSTAQVSHYIRFAKEDAQTQSLIEGLIRMQVKYLLLDPYANAFKREPVDKWEYGDKPTPSPWVWERKYEIDSLCHPMVLAAAYYAQTGTTHWMDEQFVQAMETIVHVFETEQNHETQSPYRFERENCPPTDTLARGGKGAETAYTGMTWSGFRPSDDACEYGYLVPANLMAAKALGTIVEFASLKQLSLLAARAKNLRSEIVEGIEKHAHYNHPVYGDIYAYEVDGLGNQLLMDDANVPSLLALPYMGVCAQEDVMYQRTRAFVLGKDNPYYYKGTYAAGVGSPHTPEGYIWPIALCMQAMTSTDAGEIAGLMRMLLSTHADTFFMHESFDPEDPKAYTRSWFAWANSLFGELVYRLYEQGLLQQVVALLKAA